MKIDTFNSAAPGDHSLGNLRTFQGRDFVFIEEDGVQRRVDVQLGLRSAERVEVLGGLREGQVVIGQ